MLNQRNRTKVYFLFFILIIFCIFQYGIQKIFGFSIYPDEFGYWASAAHNIGYDWSELASKGSYYSFGYSLILTPVLKLFSDSVMAYRAAVAVNMVLMCAGLFMIYKTIRDLFPEMEETIAIFAGGIAVLYPAWIFYMQMTLTEALLMFLYVAVCYFFVRFIRKPCMIYAVLLALLLVYMYFVHMRTIGTVLACAISLVLYAAIKDRGTKSINKQKWFAFFLVFIMAVLLGSLLKERTQAIIYTGADKELLSGNDYAGQWGKIRQIFSIQGLKYFLIGCLGKFFYLGMSTFGMFYWGLWFVFKQVIKLFENIKFKRNMVSNQWFYLFLFTSFLFQFLITAIYMNGYSRIDMIVYGRYNEFFLPIFMSIGIWEIYQSKHLFKETVIWLVLTGITVPIIAYVVNEKNIANIRGAFTVGISYLINEDNLDNGFIFLKIWMFGGLLLVLTVVCIWICKRWKQCYFILGMIMLMEIGLGIQASKHYTYKYNAIVYSDMDITNEIKGMEQKNVYYLYEGKDMFIDSMQFILRSREIKLLSEEEFIKKGISDDSFLIVDLDTKYKENLDKAVKNLMETSSFILYSR